MLRLFALLLGVSLGQAAGAACSPARDLQQVRQAATEAARGQLRLAAAAYRLIYEDVGYDLQMEKPAIRGAGAVVRGTLTLRGVKRATGETVVGTYPGLVSLQRQAGCRWKAVGYKRL